MTKQDFWRYLVFALSLIMAVFVGVVAGIATREYIPSLAWATAGFLFSRAAITEVMD